jgi:hypothetical protein
LQLCSPTCYNSLDGMYTYKAEANKIITKVYGSTFIAIVSYCAGSALSLGEMFVMRNSIWCNFKPHSSHLEHIIHTSLNFNIHQTGHFMEG